MRGLYLTLVEMAEIESASESGCDCASTVCSHPLSALVYIANFVVATDVRFVTVRLYRSLRPS